MLRRLAPEGLAVLGLVALAFAMPSFGFSAASSRAKAKPNYGLAVGVSGIANPTVPGQPYTYVLSVKNTGKKKMAKVIVGFDPWKAVDTAQQKWVKVITSASPKPNAFTSGDMRTTAKWTFKNVPAGATRKITLTAVWPADYNAGDVEYGHFWARTPSRANYQRTKGLEVDF